jgi:hypothetical protein
MVQHPLVSHGLIIEASRSYSDTPSGRVISPTQRPLPDNLQRSQDKDIHTLSDIRTRSPSKRAAADQWNSKCLGVLYVS